MLIEFIFVCLWWSSISRTLIVIISLTHYMNFAPIYLVSISRSRVSHDHISFGWKNIRVHEKLDEKCAMMVEEAKKFVQKEEKI